jgi:DNA replication protein DnaC
MIDYFVNIRDGNFQTWKSKVPNTDIDSSKVSDADLVIPTVDTVRHQEILCSWISEHRPFILCGPPGSGKTMTLMATLKILTDFQQRKRGVALRLVSTTWQTIADSIFSKEKNLTVLMMKTIFHMIQTM